MRWLWRAVPVVLMSTALAMLVAPRGGDTVPLFAARQGLMCQTCHFDPNGGGPRNDFGFAYARNRHSLEADPDTASQWHDLSVVNRLGDNVPIYLGVNQRFMLLATSSVHTDSLDRLGFFSMENALHVTFQPHSRLTMVYTRDGFDSGSRTQEAFGMLSGFPLGGYLKAGRFRAPFGPRWDDHTVATRNGFLDFFLPTVPSPSADAVVGRFLPYDPRDPDMGLEYGMESGAYSGRVAFTNGQTHPFGFVNTNAQAVTAKLGFNNSFYQGGVSFYDDFHHQADFSTFPPAEVGARATRWGYYGTTHYGPFTFLVEAAAGTDALGEEKRNSRAYTGEVNYTPWRWANFRLRYDRMELARGVNITIPTIEQLNTHDRFALEGEFLPVPFAELRWTLRHINHDAEVFPSGEEIPDEKQAYVQFHFAY